MKQVIKPDHILRDQLLQVMIDNQGSDMYITVGTYPAIKIGWEITYIDDGIEKLAWKDTFEFTQSLITQEQHDLLIARKNLDFSFSFSERRLRANVSFQMGNYMIVLRLLNSYIPDIESLGLPDVYKEVMKRGQWLILVTGPTGSGKTTTLASMINYVNENYNKHIITIEDPIEYLHKHKKSVMEQKEIGKDVPDYETALIGAMRQNPQVILFWEMRNRKEIENALTLAETWHLVLSTLHTRSAAQTISRIIDIFQDGEREQVRLQLADSLVAVFSQRLLVLQDGTGVKMAKEILINNSAIANLIRENDMHQIPTAMQMGKRESMQLLEEDIVQFIQLNQITEEEWLKYANNPKYIRDMIQ
jgi:twitching motility protein PilT